MFHKFLAVGNGKSVKSNIFEVNVTVSGNVEDVSRRTSSGKDLNFLNILHAARVEFKDLEISR
jgi:hypothetical protein